jgi:hypothetical protein
LAALLGAAAAPGGPGGFGGANAAGKAGGLGLAAGGLGADGASGLNAAGAKGIMSDSTTGRIQPAVGFEGVKAPSQLAAALGYLADKLLDLIKEKPKSPFSGAANFASSAYDSMNPPSNFQTT